jgi:hypothetical protein
MPSASSRVRPLEAGGEREQMERTCVGPEPRTAQRAWRGPTRCRAGLDGLGRAEHERAHDGKAAA